MLAAVADVAFGPTWGGGVIPDDPVQRLEAGRFADVPIMHGITRDEQVTFQVGFELGLGGPIPAEEYPALLGYVLGLDEAQLAAVLEEYPLRDYDDSTSWAMASIVTDWGWACPAVQTNDLFGRHVPTYAFEFADETAPWFGGAQPPPYPTGAYHASDLQYLFPRAYNAVDLSASQQRLADTMISYWTEFAHDGDPNSGRTPDWPRYRRSTDDVQSLATGRGGVRSVDLYDEHNCGFWDDLLS